MMSNTDDTKDKSLKGPPAFHECHNQEVEESACDNKQLTFIKVKSSSPSAKKYFWARNSFAPFSVGSKKTDLLFVPIKKALLLPEAENLLEDRRWRVPRLEPVRKACSEGKESESVQLHNTFFFSTIESESVTFHLQEL